MTSYSSNATTQWLDAIYNFAAYGQTEYPNAAIIPISNYIPSVSSTPIPSAILYYNATTALGGVDPTALQNFTAPNLIPITNTYTERNMFLWSQELDAGTAVLKGWRQRFHAVTAINTPEAVHIIHDTYMGVAMQMLSNITALEAALALMPVSKQWVEKSNSAPGGGDPMDLDPANAPYIFVEQSLSWESPSADTQIENFVQAVNVELNAKLDAKKLRVPYIYMNDADAGQPVFQGYPSENVARLQQIREKYDPQKVYTNLMPGGWKVADVEI